MKFILLVKNISYEKIPGIKSPGFFTIILSFSTLVSIAFPNMSQLLISDNTLFKHPSLPPFDHLFAPFIHYPLPDLFSFPSLAILKTEYIYYERADYRR
jgi:hypothetical protein